MHISRNQSYKETDQIIRYPVFIKVRFNTELHFLPHETRKAKNLHQKEMNFKLLHDIKYEKWEKQAVLNKSALVSFIAIKPDDENTLDGYLAMWNRLKYSILT